MAACITVTSTVSLHEHCGGSQPSPLYVSVSTTLRGLPLASVPSSQSVGGGEAAGRRTAGSPAERRAETWPSGRAMRRVR